MLQEMKAPVAHVAAHRFHAVDMAWWDHWRHGKPAPREVDYGYYQGWVMVEGQSHRRDDVMRGANQPVMD